VSTEIDPNELVRIIGELEVVRRLQEARIAELERALAAKQGPVPR
jgi:hypothetical protein